jgi:hypothetical protein
MYAGDNPVGGSAKHQLYGTEDSSLDNAIRASDAKFTKSKTTIKN